MKSVVINIFKAIFLVFIMITIIFVIDKTIDVDKILYKDCHAHYSKEVLIQEGVKNLPERTKELLTSSILKMNDINQITEFRNSIPLISHHVYFTTTENYKPISQSDLQNIIKNLDLLEATSSGWQHFFWTNNAEFLPKEISQRENLTIKNISELSNELLFANLQDYIEKAKTEKRFYASASDITRLLAIKNYGGIYLDLDYQLYDTPTLIKFIRAYDFLGGAIEKQTSPHASNPFIAAKKGHKIIDTAIALVYRNLNDEEKPEYIKYPCNNFDKVLSNTLIPLTVAIYESADTSADIFFPIRILFNCLEPQIPTHKSIKKIYNDISYNELPIGNDPSKNSWVGKDDHKNICYPRFKLFE